MQSALTLYITHEVFIDVPDELGVLLAILQRLWCCRCYECEPPFAVVYTKRCIEVEIETVIEEHDFEVVRRLRARNGRAYEEIAWMRVLYGRSAQHQVVDVVWTHGVEESVDVHHLAEYPRQL